MQPVIFIMNHTHVNKIIILEDQFVRVTKTKYDAGVFMPLHTHEHSAVSLILSGDFEESTANWSGKMCRSKTLLKPAHVAHSDHFEKECIILCVYLKEERIISPANRDVLTNWSSVYGVNWASFQPYLSAIGKKEKEEALNVFFNHIRKAKSCDNSVPSWIIELKHQMDHDFQSAIQTNTLAEQYEVHPVYLARVFRKYYGRGIKSYLNHLRIRNSMAEIIHSNQSLTQIAMANGFSDQSHFIRYFKEASGTTPKSFREIVC